MYYTVFDIVTAGYQGIRYVLFGMMLILAGNAMSSIIKQVKGTTITSFEIGIMRWVRGFFVFWTVMVSVISFSHYLYLLISVLTGNYEVVQGQVEQFSPMPYEGHALESFVVKGKKFEYSDYSGVTGFYNTSSHGGPIRQGLQVRISYVDDTIIKLEVKK